MSSYLIELSGNFRVDCWLLLEDVSPSIEFELSFFGDTDLKERLEVIERFYFHPSHIIRTFTTDKENTSEIINIERPNFCGIIKSDTEKILQDFFEKHSKLKKYII